MQQAVAVDLTHVLSLELLKAHINDNDLLAHDCHGLKHVSDTTHI
jgi:hypothetical protein